MCRDSRFRHRERIRAFTKGVTPGLLNKYDLNTVAPAVRNTLVTQTLQNAQFTPGTSMTFLFVEGPVLYLRLVLKCTVPVRLSLACLWCSVDPRRY